MKRKFHIVFKTHFDLGFTDYARVVEARYLDDFIPTAINLAEKLRGAPGFVWTSGSWIIHHALEVYKGKKLKALEAALTAGDISWHALPFTTHSELMTPSLFEFGLSLSWELDRRFGKRTRAANFTDVPGHTRGIIPLLAGAGVDFLHIGTNPGSTPPDVPPMFIWREPASGAELVVMYQTGGYGGIFSAKDNPAGLHLCFTEDNLGPPPEAEVMAAFEKVKNEFPGSKASASTLDAFADDFFRKKAELPVIESEIGDTWIHGAGTAPGKIRRYRELCRLRDEWLAAGVPNKYTKKFIGFSENLLCIAEHTWGMDVKTHLADKKAFSPEQLKSARDKTNFKKYEMSCAEQEEYVGKALDALAGSPMKKEAADRLAATEPEFPAPALLRGAARWVMTFSNDFFDAGFSPEHGGLTHLAEKKSGRRWAVEDNPLGLLKYQVFGAEDITRFLDQYGLVKDSTADWWFPYDFGKPGLERVLKKGRGWNFQLKRATVIHHDDCAEVIGQLAPPEKLKNTYGCPHEVFLHWKFHNEKPEISLRLTWRGKPASRIPEALWLGFSPTGTTAPGWQFEKLGSMVSPLDVVKNGNCKLHAVDTCVEFRDRRGGMKIFPLDSALVAPGEPSLYDFNNRRPPMKQGVHFNLYNNAWGTNFPQWCGEDASFRFILKFY